MISSSGMRARAQPHRGVAAQRRVTMRAVAPEAGSAVKTAPRKIFETASKFTGACALAVVLVRASVPDRVRGSALTTERTPVVHYFATPRVPLRPSNSAIVRVFIHMYDMLSSCWYGARVRLPHRGVQATAVVEPAEAAKSGGRAGGSAGFSRARSAAPPPAKTQAAPCAPVSCLGTAAPNSAVACTQSTGHDARDSTPLY